MRATFWGLLLGFGLFAPHARAEDLPSAGARLSFVRTANATECIAGPELERQIVARMGRDPFTGPPRQWIEGVVDFSDGDYAVELFERDLEGKTLGMRKLRAPAGDCHQLDEAMVLAIALILDPSLQLTPRPNGAPPAPSEVHRAVVLTPSGASMPPRPAPVASGSGESLRLCANHPAGGFASDAHCSVCRHRLGRRRARRLAGACARG